MSEPKTTDPIEENHAIYTLTGPPREGYTLQQEIRAQLEEAHADVIAALRERDSLRALAVRLRAMLLMARGRLAHRQHGVGVECTGCLFQAQIETLVESADARAAGLIDAKRGE